MALEAQIVEVPPASGTNEGDGKYVPIEGLHRAENAVFRRTRELVKRNGYGEMIATSPDGSLLGAPSRVASVGSELLCVAADAAQTGSSLYSLSSRGWVPRGHAPTFAVTGRRVLARPVNDGLLYAPQVARIGTFEATVYAAGASMPLGMLAYSVVLRVVDLSTGAVVYDGLVPTLGTKVLLLATGTVFTLAIVDISAVVRRCTFDPITGALSAPLAIVGVSGAPVSWDAIATIGNNWCIALVRSAQIDVVRIDAAGLVTAGAVITTSATQVALSHAGGVLLVAWDDATRATHGIEARTYAETTLTGGLAPWLVRTLAGDDVPHALACAVAPDGTLLVASTCSISGVPGGVITNPPLRTHFDPFDGTGASLDQPFSAPHLWHVVLGGRPFAIGDSLYVVVHARPDDVLNDSGGINTPSTPDGSQTPVAARMFGYALVNLRRRRGTWQQDTAPFLFEGVFAGLDGRGMDLADVGTVLPLPAVTDGRATIPIAVYRGGDDVTARRTIVADAIDLDTATPNEGVCARVEALGLLAQGGAWPTLYDGQGLVEPAFLQPPGVVLTTREAGPGPEVPEEGTNTFVYYLLYRWRDARGLLHVSRRSAPYTVETAPLPGSGPPIGSVSITFLVLTTPLTRCHDPSLGALRRVEIVLYRSKKNDPSAHYEVTSSNVDVPTNAASAAYVTIVDTATDADLTDPTKGLRPTIYTDGGALDCEAPPALRHLSAHGGRLWGVSAERNEVWFTRPLIAGEAPAWSAFQRVALDDIAGRVVATAGQDGNTLIFTDAQVCLLQGNGPNDTGSPPFAPPDQLAVGRGCRDARSVLSWRGGVAWLAQDGLVALSRRLELVPLGRPVERTVARWSSAAYGSFVSAHVDPARDRLVWLGTTSGDQTTAAVYDVALDAWTTWTIPRTTSDALWRGVHVLATEAAVAQETEASAVDLGVWFETVIELPWLRVGALGGYQRLWRVHVEMEALGGAGLEMGFFVDGEDGAAVQTETWLSSQLIGLPRYPLVPLVVGVARQKSATVKLRYRDLPPDDDRDAGGFVYHGTSLQIGVKRGLWKGAKENVRLWASSTRSSAWGWLSEPAA